MPVRARNRPADPRVTIVIPAKNEARNLEEILPRLPDVHEVVLVDGRSVDGTLAVARRLMPDIKIVHQTRRGKGNALACGFEAATGEIIVTFDADGSADPREIPRFVDVLRRGADFAKGSRFSVGDGPDQISGSDDLTRLRRLGNYGLNVLANSMMRTRYTDLCYGYNAFWADILEHLDLPPTELGTIGPSTMIWGDGFEVETLITCRIAAAQLSVAEVPSYEACRIHGTSNLNAVSDGWRVLKTIATERRRTKRLVREPAIQRRPAPAAAVGERRADGVPAARDIGAALPAGQDTDYVDESIA